MLPQDPFILLSYLNTKLRDEYSTLDALCEDLGVPRAELEDALKKIAARYDAEKNAFIL